MRLYCIKAPISPHPYQYLLLSIFFYYSHPSESEDIHHCCFDFPEILKRFEQGMPHFHFTLGPTNDVAGPNWSKITIKGFPAWKSHTPSFFAPETKKRLGRGRKEKKPSDTWKNCQVYPQRAPTGISIHPLSETSQHFYPTQAFPSLSPFRLNFFKRNGTNPFIIHSTTVCYLPAGYSARPAGTKANSPESLDSGA